MDQGLTGFTLVKLLFYKIVSNKHNAETDMLYDQFSSLILLFIGFEPKM